MKSKPSLRKNQMYLLRLERVQRGTDKTWLVFLQPVASGERRAFGSLDSLTAFLKQECGELESDAKPFANAAPYSPL